MLLLLQRRMLEGRVEPKSYSAAKLTMQPRKKTIKLEFYDGLLIGHLFC